MKLHYKKIGDSGPNLIILHGLFGMLDNWQSLARQFAQHFQVYLIDQRNHGRSPHSPDMDYFLLADDLLAFMETHELTKAHLIGHSMGGKVAMQFAVEQADYVDKLVVVDIAPKSYASGHGDIFASLYKLDIKNIHSRKQAENELSQQLEEPAVVQFLLKNLKRQKDGAYVWKFNLAAIHQNYPYIIANSLSPYDSFDGATLFVKGGRSPRYIDLAEDAPLIEHQFPNSQIITIQNTGHWVHAEQPAAFLEVVKKFLA